MHTIFFIVTVSLWPLQPPSGAFETAIRMCAEAPLLLEETRVKDVQAAISVIREQGRDKAAGAIGPLLRLAREDSAWPVWQDALRTTCVIAGPGDVPRIIALVRQKLDDLAASNRVADDALRERLIYRTTTLCGIFVDECARLLPMDGAEPQQCLVALLTDMEVPAERGWTIGGDPRDAALTLLPPGDPRSDHVIQYIARTGRQPAEGARWGAIGAWMAPYLNQRVQDGLFRVITTELQQGRSPPRMAAGILAELGDERMLPILQSQQAKEDAGFGAKQVWQIEAQNPPTKLLDAIKGSLDEPADRAWAVRRALAHGLPKEDIRAAIRAYCDRADQTIGWRLHAFQLKDAALRFDLLGAGDFPEIPSWVRNEPGTGDVLYQWVLTGRSASPTR